MKKSTTASIYRWKYCRISLTPAPAPAPPPPSSPSLPLQRLDAEKGVVITEEPAPRRRMVRCSCWLCHSW